MIAAILNASKGVRDEVETALTRVGIDATIEAVDGSAIEEKIRTAARRRPCRAAPDDEA